MAFALESYKLTALVVRRLLRPQMQTQGHQAALCESRIGLLTISLRGTRRRLEPRESLRILDAFAKQQVSAGFRGREGNAFRIAQRLSTAIQMANSQAVLKRLPQPANGCVPIVDLADADEDFLFQS